MGTTAKTLSVRAAWLEYGISRDLIRRAIDRGELPALRPGLRTIRIFRDDLDSWLKSKRFAPSAESGSHADRVVERRLDREAGGA